MANIIVERSAIADFLDDLPGLLMQYKQMEWAMEERALEREERKAAGTQQILLKEYYDKKAEVRTTEKVFDQYDNLKPSDVSSSGGGAELISIVDNQNNIDMDAITQNLNTLSTYQSGLESSLGELRGQAQILQEMQLDYAGPEGVLEQDEYEEFRKHALTAMDEGGLGWTTTAGADVEFYKKDPTTRQLEAMKISEHMQKEAKAGATTHYAILQAVFTPGEGEDTDDLVDKLTYEDASGNEIEPSKEIIGAIQNMAGQSGSYDDFLTNLAAYELDPALGGGQIRRELLANPNTQQLFNNLQRHAKAISTLDNELAGINEPDQATDIDNFVSSISEVTNKEALFGLYDQAISGKDPSLHEPFFNAIEAQLGGIDAYPEYKAYKGLGGGDPEEDKDIGSLIPSQKELALQSLASLNQQIGADSTYMAEYDAIADSLEEVQDYSYDRFLELAKLDPDNVDPYLLPSRARLVWWGMASPSNDIEEEIARLGGDYRSASGQQMLNPFPDPVEDRLEDNRAKRIEMERTLQLLEGND